jgi:Transcriptional regulator LmrA/YxaF-like, C-terminal domain
MDNVLLAALGGNQFRGTSSDEMTQWQQAVLGSWILVIAAVFIRDGSSPGDAKRNARSLIGAIQGALILARVWSSSEPLNDVARKFV